MILGHLFLLVVLLIIILLVVAYLHYKWKLNQYKRKGCWNFYDITYMESVMATFAYFVAIGTIVVLLYAVITNWNMPI